MKFKEDRINELLADWDLAGTSNVDAKWPFVEYKSYIVPMINFYHKEKDVFEFVLRMFNDILGTPSENNLSEIGEYANKFNKIMEEEEAT